MRRTTRSNANAMVLLAALALGFVPAASAQDAAAAARTGPPTRQDFEKLERELKEQRRLLMQFLQMEEQRYQFLLKLVQARESGTAAPAAPSPPPSFSGVESPAAAAAENNAAKAAEVALAVATVTGTVEVKGGSTGDIYVYVENVKAPPVRGRTFEIRQKGKEFVPAVAALQRGTTVNFPNADPIFHNVFSPSPTQPFDLGTYRAGDPSRSVRFLNPGVVEIYCNMHGRMRASVLVVPNAVFTKAAADGTFRLPNVPVGTRRLVAWSQDARPSLQTVAVAAGGATAKLVLEVAPGRQHDNKLGQPYGSYGE